MTISNSPSSPSAVVEKTLWLPAKKAAGSYYKDIMVALLLLAAPFLLFPRGYGLLALLVLPGLWGLRRLLVGQIIPRTPLDSPVLLLLVMTLVSLGATFELSFSIGKVAGLLLGIVVYYAVIDLSPDEAALRRLLAFFILTGLGIACLGVLGTRWPDKFPLLQSLLERLPEALRQMRGAEDGFNPNQVAGVLLFFVPLQLMLGWYWLGRLSPRKKSGKAGSFLALLLTGLSLVITGGVLLLTQSRGGLGGLVIGLLALAAIRTRWGKLLTLATAAALAWLLYSGVLSSLLGPGLETESAGTLSLVARVEIWSRGLAGLQDFPLGMGMNNFRRVMPVLYPTFSVNPTSDVAHAHNHLLQAGLDLGLPGLVAYLALWLGAGVMLLQTIRPAHRPLYRAVALGLLGGLTAHFIYGLTDAVALGAKPGFVFWWTLGLAAAVYCLSQRSTAVETLP